MKVFKTNNIIPLRKNLKRKISFGIISLLMLAIFMAPVSLLIQINKNNNLALKFETKKAKAVNLTDYLEQDSYIKANSSTAYSINIDVGVIINEKYREQRADSSFLGYDNINGAPNQFDASNEIREKGLFICYSAKDLNETCFSWQKLALAFQNTLYKNEHLGLTLGTDIFKELKPNTEYTIILAIKEGEGTRQGITNSLFFDFTDNDIIKSTKIKTLDKKTGEDEKTYTDSSKSYAGSGSDGTVDLSCGVTNLGGCIAQIFYTIWSVSAWFARLAGEFLDFFIYYSTNSNSYSNTFVEKAWAAVRDIANIFFIIALFYVAVKTILGLNVSNNKKLVGMVIVIGLVINFSLFTTKLVIDGSNILAKVFYNNITSTDSKTQKDAVGTEGQKSISVGIVDKFNPQGILTPKTYDQMGVGKFIFLTLLLTLITLYTAYIFFSVALLFVARVVSLWISMIFSPLAFASYTVPFEIPGFGHKEWWPELLKNAFLAPLFVFMLYIIVLFAGFLNTIAKYTSNPDLSTNANLMQHLMSIVIPFIILMMLLKKSKELTQKYAGEMGKAIVGLGAVAGGLAIGGTAMGLGAIGKGTFGAFMKGASTGDTAANRMQGAAARIANHQATLTNPNSTIVERTRARKEIKREQRDQIKGAIQNFGIGGLSYAGAQNWLGQRLNQDQHNIEHAAHARHDLDTVAGEIAHGKKWDDLNGEQRFQARRKMERDRVVRDNAGATAAPVGSTNYVAGLGGIGLGTRKWDALTGAERDAIDAVVGVQVGGHHAGQAAVGGRLDTYTTHADQHIIQEAREKQGIISNVIQSGVTGSYDIRGLSKVIAKEQNTGFSKIAAGITGALALGLRSGLKSTLNINYGESQGNFFKDLGHTISEALKGAKVNVDLSHVGHEAKEDAHGGHGGGGHH